jgi:AraC-like DNA-binding protein
VIEKQNIYELGITLGSKLKSKFKLPMFVIPEKLKKGFSEIIELRQGLKLIINDYKPKKELSIDFTVDTPPLEFAYCISGSAEAIIKIQKKEAVKIKFQKGNCTIFYLPKSSGTITIAPEEKLRIVSLHISPEFLSSFMDNDYSGMPQAIIDIIKGESDNSLLINDDISPQMQLALSQIYDNHFSGVSRNMFLESKALEIMTLQISGLIENSNIKELKIRESDIKKVNKVKETIEEQYLKPPSLTELASLAAMSHTKLNFIFKKLYNYTVFEFIRKKRLEYSLKLIIENELTMSEIAYEAGWSNPGHFTREFKKYYGKSPTQYRQIL